MREKLFFLLIAAAALLSSGRLSGQHPAREPHDPAF